MKKYAVIMAAGKGSRMMSTKPKVAHEVLYKPMINHIIDEVKKIDVDEIYIIVGHESDQVMRLCVNENVTFVKQEQQLGTGHAVMQVTDYLSNKEGVTIVLNGDAPLITAGTLNEMINTHLINKNKGTIMTCDCPVEYHFGRIVKVDNQVVEIVEYKDLTNNQFDITEMNVGEYCFDNKELFEALKLITNNNAANEYYLPDVFKKMHETGLNVGSHKINDLNEVGGINDKIELAKANKMLQRRINSYHMQQGVTIVDPDTTYIGSDVIIGKDTLIEPGCIIKGKTVIGNHCILGPQCELDNVQIGNNVIIKFSVISDSRIDDGVDIGPYARLRTNCHIKENVHLGNFVEMKKTIFGKNSKCAHLSYLGDSVIGDRVNIGCGTISVNYDGKNKSQTIIGDDAFIGCNANLIAPVDIKNNAFIAAGSTITNDVPEDSFAIARAKQVNKEGYAKKLEQVRNKIWKNRSL